MIIRRCRASASRKVSETLSPTQLMFGYLEELENGRTRKVSAPAALTVTHTTAAHAGSSLIGFSVALAADGCPGWPTRGGATACKLVVEPQRGGGRLSGRRYTGGEGRVCPPARKRRGRTESPVSVRKFSAASDGRGVPDRRRVRSNDRDQSSIFVLRPSEFNGACAAAGSRPARPGRSKGR